MSSHVVGAGPTNGAGSDGGLACTLTWKQQLLSSKGDCWLAHWPGCPGRVGEPSKPVLAFLPVAAGYITGWKISDRIMFP